MFIPALTTYDWWVLSSSAGKDSAAMLDYLVEQAHRVGFPLDRIVVVHCDLGRFEWPSTRELGQDLVDRFGDRPGTLELARLQAERYGLRFEVRGRTQSDLLDQVRHYGYWPTARSRYCTSAFKREVVTKFITELVDESNLDRPVRILNCMGMRAEESSARAKRPQFKPHDTVYRSNGRRVVDTYLPIHLWTLSEVWDRVELSRVQHHWAYDAGMSRLSCSFCILASLADLVTAAKLRPELAREYAKTEREIDHDFKQGLSMAALIERAAGDHSVPRPKPGLQLPLMVL